LVSDWKASSYVQWSDRTSQERDTLSTIRQSRSPFRATAELTIRGGGRPYSNLAMNADRKNGPAARSFAADAYDCIMVRIKRSYCIQVCDTKIRPQWRAPL